MHVSTNITGLPILRNKGKCYMTHLPLQVNYNDAQTMPRKEPVLSARLTPTLFLFYFDYQLYT